MPDAVPVPERSRLAPGVRLHFDATRSAEGNGPGVRVFSTAFAAGGIRYRGQSPIGRQRHQQETMCIAEGNSCNNQACYAPLTRQITSPTSSAISTEPSGPIVTPTGRP
jgi:hypothetical protein